MHTQKFQQQRRFWVVVPILVLPFVVALFWALGGGKTNQKVIAEESNGHLNANLPGAHFKNEKNAWDKLSLYEQAQRDSARFREAQRTDPYVNLPALTPNVDTTDRGGNIIASLGKKEASIEETEAQVHEKLATLNQSLQAQEVTRKPRYERTSPSVASSTTSQDVQRLEAMMHMMQSGGQENEELEEMQSVLDKILDIQHPERVQAKSNETNPKRNDHAYHAIPSLDDKIHLLKSDDHLNSIPVLQTTNQFFGLLTSTANHDHSNAIAAEVAADQSLVSGATVKLVLLQDVGVNHVMIPKATFVYGLAALNGERLLIKITSVRHGNAILPVSLSVHDLDGLEGIYVPGAISRDVAKQSSTNALQDVGLNSLNPSLEVQAASAGVETVKNLLTKKARLIKVSLKAGYQVLLVSNQNH